MRALQKILQYVYEKCENSKSIEDNEISSDIVKLECRYQSTKHYVQKSNDDILQTIIWPKYTDTLAKQVRLWKLCKKK